MKTTPIHPFRFILTLFIVVTSLSLSSTTLFAQADTDVTKIENSIKKNGKYALLVQKTNHLKAAIKTGENFKAQSAKIQFQIVVCGELVKEISNDESLKTLISEANSKGIKILACGLSIKQFQVDTTLLPTVMPITENGLIYMFGLQENGFVTIEL